MQNLGDAILSGTATVNGNGVSLVSGGTYELESGETATVTVRFAPGSVATFSGTLVLNGGDGGTINVALSGVGTLTDKGDSATGCGSAPGANGGPMADLLLVDGDPLTDSKAFFEPRIVVSDGKVAVEGAAL